MIKSSKNDSIDAVCTKLRRIKSNNSYDIPNVFQTILKKGISIPEWRHLMSHPYTASYARHHLTSYVQSVREMLLPWLHDKDNNEFVRETLAYLHKTILFERNRKRVYVAVVENILPLLVESYDIPEARATLDDVVLSKEAMSLLEANLLSNMSNYTSVGVQQARALDISHCAQFFEIMCTMKKSKNFNKVLLKVYLTVSGSDVGRNVALLEVIRRYRVYQLAEDRDQGFPLTKHLSSLLSSLSEEEFSSLAVSALPLNSTVVSLHQAFLYCNDNLLATLVRTYHRTGTLPHLFQQLILHFNPTIRLHDKTRLTLAIVCKKLSDLQTIKIMEMFCCTLEENCSTEYKDTVKRQRAGDEELCEFIAECCVTLLSNTDVSSLPPDTLQRLHSVTDKLGPAAVKVMQLYFNKAVLSGTIPATFLFEVKGEAMQDGKELEMIISHLQYSESTADDLDAIISSINTHPKIVLSNCLVFYHLLHLDHMYSIARYLLTAGNDEFTESEVFSRLSDLHCVLIVCVLQSITGAQENHLSDPLRDLTLSSARDMIRSELSTPILYTIQPFGNPVRTIKLLSQVSLNSCYVRLLVTTWILCRRLCGSEACSLVRFCRPPFPHTPLPALLGKHTGQVLSELLPAATPFVSTFLRMGVSIYSADLTQLIEFLAVRPERYHEVVGGLVSALSTHPSLCTRYREALLTLKTRINKVLMHSSEGSVVKCDLLCAACSLNSTVLDTGTVPHYQLALTLLKTQGLDVVNKTQLVQTMLDNIEEEEQVIIITETLLDILDENVSLYNDDFSFKCNSKVFIGTLMTQLPRKSAELVLNHTMFDVNLVDPGNTHIPVSLIPKLITKLSKSHVMKCLKAGEQDPYLLSKVLLCLLQHKYPIHLLNSIFNSILSALSTKGYNYKTDMNTVSNVVRSCELLSKDEVSRHHAPYILYTILEWVCQSNADLVRDISPAVYPLLDVCLVQGLQFLQARLTSPARQVFLQLQDHYKNYVKYQGKT